MPQTNHENDYSINCRGRLIELSEPIVMGVLNVTPDSFYDGGRYRSDLAALRQAEKMLQAGATIIDVGGMSSRPGAEIITKAQELDRVLPAIQSITKAFPSAIISIDTVHASVARASVEHGASIVNDISAGRMDEKLLPTVAELGVPYILMHMQGKPKNMQDAPQYTDAIQEVMNFLTRKVGDLRALGVKDIILDVGFGFGKTIQHNYQLLRNMQVFQILGLPVLAGVSRKSMIYRLLEITPAEALNGTTALHMVALQQGANILRVHDVKEAMEVIKLWKQLKG